ncbi:ABC transporter ATP-binding protein [Mucilaginibacter glaciei]|uniref:ATP-binding cassette domain-containing protein n=1 Tax=Mucilaginibacter glaciei TaxID=2772109 RepID=A0A926S1P5_9SPHI|nr:polysaccharide ABC transporter ATP-binding protein [Mucilaginibacter glaciei]MBD1393293.1 ATP-binding cassette domain-containing protein [Mucilaginibacter glaciei]
MSDIAIKAENLSKAYQLGDFGTGTLSNDINRWWSLVRGKEDPFLKIGEANDRAIKGTTDVVWSLKDLNFEIKQGDAVGIIGRNGAGKSTLLKLLSRVTAPTTGMIKAKGRIASLLEVGTGFHPDLTGRENIFLNGAILGMRKYEIARKFDEIVDFSGVERYIDTPVKRYSSGMYVRLAFAIAAYLESEILIVDEVLAVGDAEFQRKCLGKMSEVSKGEGRTVLFVSHNLNSVLTLCAKGIYLKNGALELSANIDEVVRAYAKERDTEYSRDVKIISEGKQAWLSNFKITDHAGSEHLEMESPVLIEVEVESTAQFDNIQIGIGINDYNEVRLLTLFSKFYNKAFTLHQGSNKLSCKMDRLNLKPGLYKVEIFIGSDHLNLDYYSSGLQFEIFPSLNTNHLLPDSSQGSMFVNQNWF